MHNSPVRETHHSNFGVGALSQVKMVTMEEVLFRETNNLFGRAYVEALSASAARLKRRTRTKIDCPRNRKALTRGALQPLREALTLLGEDDPEFLDG